MIQLIASHKFFLHQAVNGGLINEAAALLCAKQKFVNGRIWNASNARIAELMGWSRSKASRMRTAWLREGWARWRDKDLELCKVGRRGSGWWENLPNDLTEKEYKDYLYFIIFNNVARRHQYVKNWQKLLNEGYTASQRERDLFNKFYEERNFKAVTSVDFTLSMKRIARYWNTSSSTASRVIARIDGWLIEKKRNVKLVKRRATIMDRMWVFPFLPPQGTFFDAKRKRLWKVEMNSYKIIGEETVQGELIKVKP